eukprot:CAMPEP_0168744074 /NCGR_PEP_ID=MMETSP0724-20121128/13903_1 /TAXON_ID=265536 /ORGANISM="Amphiprora sp., Strain CCMP467" /LENGTH=240 /DNA_ID=CAMNT_0008791721 /DNA_START=74 /DNA_END=796 /DNA_ORIENTATION=+
MAIVITRPSMAFSSLPLQQRQPRLVGVCHGAREDSNTESTVAASNEPPQQQQQQLKEFLQRARQLGPIGAVRSPEEQAELLQLAQDLATTTTTGSGSDPEPARIPLTGVHNLIYSTAPGGSSGKIFQIGTITIAGQVQQTFVDDVTFINSVQLGPLRLSLRAEREVRNDTDIQVIFRETTVSLLGKVLLTKPLENNQSGVWRYLHASVIDDDDDENGGRKKLIRVMTTPSLFVLEHTLSE